MKTLLFAVLLVSFVVISVAMAMAGSDNVAECIGDCASDQGICIAECNGNGQCIGRCAAAYGRCVSRCH